MGLLLRKLNSKQKGLLLNNPFYEKKWVSSEIFMPSWAFGRKKLRCFNGPTTTTTTTAAPTARATTNATTMTMRRQLCSLVCEKRLSKKTWAGVRLKLRGFKARKGEVQILIVLRWCSIDWLSLFSCFRLLHSGVLIESSSASYPMKSSVGILENIEMKLNFSQKNLNITPFLSR